jgi:hypothetical protein
VARLGLQRDQATPCGQRPAEPDRAVPAQRADLENGSRALKARKQLEQLPLKRRDVVGWQVGGGAGRKRRVQRRIPRDE